MGPFNSSRNQRFREDLEPITTNARGGAIRESRRTRGFPPTDWPRIILATQLYPTTLTPTSQRRPIPTTHLLTHPPPPSQHQQAGGRHFIYVCAQTPGLSPYGMCAPETGALGLTILPNRARRWTPRTAQFQQQRCQHWFRFSTCPHIL